VSKSARYELLYALPWAEITARRRAEDVVGSIAGVVSVMNNLRVRQPGGTGATG
jgi:hypothetical protein